MHEIEKQYIIKIYWRYTSQRFDANDSLVTEVITKDENIVFDTLQNVLNVEVSKIEIIKEEVK